MLRKPNSKLLVRYFSSTCTEKEKLKIEAWINSSPKNKDLFDRLKAVWDVSSQVGKEWDYARPLEKLSAKINETGGSSWTNRGFRLHRITPQPKRASSSLKTVIAIAATLIALIGSLYTIRYLREIVMEKQSLERAKQFALWEAQTKPGQQVTLNFADGTKVVLNSASQLKYSISSQGVREVYLQGEAYFEVVHSDAQPFILHVVDGTIRDIGTKFDVKAWPDDERTRLAVIEGMISVQPNGRTQENILVRGHQYCVIGKGGVMVPPSYTNVSRDIQWLDGKQAFHNEAMSDVVRQIWRIYGIHCFVSDTSILSKRITTSFDNRDPAKRVLDIIALSLNLKYKIWKDSVLFVPSEPLFRESKRINNTKDASYEKGEVHQ